MTLRKQDNQSEAAVAAFLDQHFYPTYTSNFQRFIDRETQFKGIDVIFNYQGEKRIVDEKSAAHYVNKNLPTFAFELDFIGRDYRLHNGWFYDESKKTEYYLLTWIWALKEKGFTAEDITKLDIVLVSRAKIKAMLDAEGLKKEDALRMSQSLRQKNQFGVAAKSTKPYYFYFTKHLFEKPINIIIRKAALQKISLLNLTLTTKSNTTL